MSFRPAGPADAPAVAALHAESWRRHYRGAYSDAFLDGDVHADRLAAWREQLGASDPLRHTLLAESDTLVGFANTLFEHDPEWGALLENLHVARSHQRLGIGTRLLARTAAALLERRRASGLYVWVLEQNAPARAFYEASGAEPAGVEPVTPPGGVAGRLCGSPAKLRYAWADPARLLAGR